MEEKLNTAIQLLQLILLESSIENEFDKDIYNFLKENDALPEGYVPYFSNEFYEN